MDIENGESGTEWKYGDEETYDDVLEWFNDNDMYNPIVKNLISGAEDLLKKFEDNYLEPEGPAETGVIYPQAHHFEDGSNEQVVGRALTVLAEMPDELTKFDYWDETRSNGKTYDLTSASYERICEVLEATTKVEDENLNWADTG